ncbi:transketolase family protein [Butyricimonas paravirosa]|uniref:transketolase family protein n=1 Tax=Butyricimonas paravirosa TaxID=1472417 RepID=UPI002A829334|nr:transketolase C-terminal domain-containing protein [Butyricimonas paravirosa]
MKINGGLIKAYSQMGQKGAASGIGMLEVVKRNPDVVAVVADSVAIASLDRFQKLYPDKIVNVGIAEQNMIGIAAGLASESGKSVYAFTYSAFIIARALEQVRLNLAYHQFNVKLVGNSAGFAMEMLGVSHWAVEDIAFTRVLPNMTVLSAADSLQAIKMVIAADEIDTPVYIRLSGGQNIPVVYEQDFEYRIGKAIKLKEGKDIAIIATGLMVHESLLAAELLEKRGIHCSVIDMHTIKPLDEEILDNVFSTFELIVTVEEHNVIGGLGSAVAEYKGSRKNAPRQVFIGVKDQYLKLGTQRYIWQQYGLTAEQIANKIISEI